MGGSLLAELTGDDMILELVTMTGDDMILELVTVQDVLKCVSSLIL